MPYLILAIHFDIDATDGEAIRDTIEQLQQAGFDHIKRVDLLNENDYIDNTTPISTGYPGDDASPEPPNTDYWSEG